MFTLDIWLVPNVLRPVARFGSVTLMALCFGLIYGCAAPSEIDTTASQTSPRTVRVQQVDAGQVETRPRLFQGRTAPQTRVALSFRVGGKIHQSQLEVGQTVRAGESLARLNDTDFRTRLAEAEAALREARAGLQQATAEYTRIRTLFANDSASRSALDGAQASYDRSVAALEAATQRRDLAQSQVSYTGLKAPRDGRIVQVLAEPGENVTAGQPVARLESGAAQEVEISVPEQHIATVQVGDTATVRFPALPQTTPIQGTVSEVGTAPPPGGSGYPVLLTLSQTPQALRSGMAAQARFDVPDDAALRVPPAAVAADADGQFVWRVVPSDSPRQGTVERRPVEIGELNPTGLEVRSGLALGDWIVVAGTSYLDVGDAVRWSELDPLAPPTPLTLGR